jgi:hypothetical protein
VRQRLGKCVAEWKQSTETLKAQLRNAREQEKEEEGKALVLSESAEQLLKVRRDAQALARAALDTENMASEPGLSSSSPMLVDHAQGGGAGGSGAQGGEGGDGEGAGGRGGGSADDDVALQSLLEQLKLVFFCCRCRWSSLLQELKQMFAKMNYIYICDDVSLV